MKRSLSLINESMKIYGILSEVENSMDIVVLFHGFTGDKNEANDLFIDAENFFNKAGISTFRFDFRFSKTNSNKSESDGEISDMLPSAWISDGLLVTEEIKSLFPLKKIHLIGLSMGGLVGMHVASREKVSSLVLWSAVIDSKLLLNSVSSSDNWIKSIMPQNYEAFLEDFVRNNPINLYGKLKYLPVLIVAGEKDSVVPVTQAEMLHKLLENSKLIVVSEADHVFSTKKENLLKVTLDWIKSS